MTQSQRSPIIPPENEETRIRKPRPSLGKKNNQTEETRIMRGTPPATESTQIRKTPPPATESTQIRQTPPPATESTQIRQTPPPRPPRPTNLTKSTPPVHSLAPGQPTLERIINFANESGYSDIHLGVGEVPRVRDRGEMVLTDFPVTDKDTFMSWLSEVLIQEEIDRFEDTLEFDGATQYPFARVRINVFETLTGSAMVMRLIPLKILTLEQLKLPEVFKSISDAHKGLVLVTGPTGSGKSTTMAAMVDYINKNHAKHIITIEDPVEFVHRSRKSLIKQREVGMHTKKFDNALKAALREDPDIILIGEMRDKETVNTALKAAQTGHLVMGTLHTNSAVKTLERILSLYSAEEQDAMRTALSESIVSIISQGLCRTTDGKRAAYHDILINTETIKDYIRQSKYDEIVELMKDGEFDGMVTTNKALFNLYQQGRITEETALERSPTPNEMAQWLRGRV